MSVCLTRFSSSLFLFALCSLHAAQELESIQKLKKEPADVAKNGGDSGDKDYKPHGLAQREAQGAYSRRSKRIMKEVMIVFRVSEHFKQT